MSSIKPPEEMVRSVAESLLTRRQDQIEVALPESALLYGPEFFYGPRQARHEAKILLRRVLNEPRDDDDPTVLSLRDSILKDPRLQAQVAAEQVRLARLREAAGEVGPKVKPIVTREEMDQARRDLEAGHEPSGERSIARRLGASRGAVRYALGKDHGRR